jgi:hypothetical protein
MGTSLPGNQNCVLRPVWDVHCLGDILSTVALAALRACQVRKHNVLGGLRARTTIV